MLSKKTVGRALVQAALALLIPVSACAASAPPASGKPNSSAGVGPSVKQVVEFTRIVRSGLLDLDEIKDSVSPSRQRAFVVTRRADVDRDLNVYEFLLLDVRPERLGRGQPEPPRRLLRFEGANDNFFNTPFVQDAHWVSDSMIAFRGRLAEGPYQVYTLEADSGLLTQRTFEPDGVASFSVAGNLSRVVYSTWVPNPPMAPGERSVVVANRSFYSVTAPQNYSGAQQQRFQYAVIDFGTGGLGRRLGGVTPAIGGAVMPTISVAPDGRWALIPRFEPERHVEWSKRYPMMGETASQFGTALLMDPEGYFTRPRQWLARRHIAYRLGDAAEQVPVDAPDDATPFSRSRADRLWQDGGASVIIGGTHLPPSAGTAGVASTASHVVEYWPDSGKLVNIAALDGRVETMERSADGRGFAVVLEGGRRRGFSRGPAGGWVEAPIIDARPQGGQPMNHPLSDGWQLQIDQALNRPADLVAVGPRGQRVRLTTLNPSFSESTWGTMRPFSWQDQDGQRYDGGLMVPASYDPSRRYPLVMQTYGFNPSRFYLDGGNMVDGATSGYAGRAFLREDILVLAMPNLGRSPGAPRDVGIRHKRGAAMARSAIDALVEQKVADPSRIGIMGWSVWGEHVLNMLIFHDLPVRAASLLDGDSNSLWSQTVTFGASDYIVRRFEATNEGTPFGGGLANWIARDPSLHSDCIRAAVRFETYGPVVQSNWDLYALLRRQYKPAEMVVIPGGNHALARPSERMISLQGNVDWYAFWLQDKERQETVIRNETPQVLQDQNSRWNLMARMKKADEGRPRCEAVAKVRGTD